MKIEEIQQLFSTYFGKEVNVQREGENHILVTCEGVHLLSSIAQAESKSSFQFVVGTGRTSLWRYNDKT